MVRTYHSEAVYTPKCHWLDFYLANKRTELRRQPQRLRTGALWRKIDLSVKHLPALEVNRLTFRNLIYALRYYVISDFFAFKV